ALEELLLQLALPLTNGRRRRQDQRAAGKPANRELLVDDARLDRLAEPHLVGEDGAAAHVAQHPLRYVDLVGQLRDRVGLERDQPVEPRDEGDPLGVAPQLVPGTLGRRPLELLGEQLERPFVHRPGIVRRCGGGSGATGGGVGGGQSRTRYSGTPYWKLGFGPPAARQQETPA